MRAFGPIPRLATALDPVGIAGTITTLAAASMRLDPYDGAKVHGHTMSLDALRAVVAELAQMKLDARRRARGVEAGRADVIVTGGLIAIAFLSHVGARRCRVSDRGVRWGLAISLAGTT